MRYPDTLNPDIRFFGEIFWKFRAVIVYAENDILMFNDVLRCYVMFHWKSETILALFLNVNLRLFFDFKHFLRVKTDIYIYIYIFR